MERIKEEIICEIEAIKYDEELDLSKDELIYAEGYLDAMNLILYFIEKRMNYE